MHKVFVYGTLLSGFGNHQRLMQSAELVAKQASIQGRMYSLGGFPGVRLDEEGVVLGELYQVDDDTLSNLDALEGHPYFYKRIPTNVTITVEGQTEPTTQECLVYQVNAPYVRHAPKVSSGDWRAYTGKS